MRKTQWFKKFPVSNIWQQWRVKISDTGKRRIVVKNSPLKAHIKYSFIALYWCFCWSQRKKKKYNQSIHKNFRVSVCFLRLFWLQCKMYWSGLTVSQRAVFVPGVLWTPIRTRFYWLYEFWQTKSCGQKAYIIWFWMWFDDSTLLLHVIFISI